MIPVPSGLALKAILALGAIALFAGAVAYVQSLRVEIAEQRTEIASLALERDQEKATAVKNLDAYRAAEAQRLVEGAMRATAEARDAASRRRIQDLTREMERAPTARNQLSPTLRPLLRRRVQ